MAKAKEISFSNILANYAAKEEVPMTPTGVLPLDDLFGGGINYGSMYAFWGPAGCGKSTIALQTAKSFCKRGEKVLWIDSERALNANQQRAFGVREFVEDGTLIHVVATTYKEAGELIYAACRDKEAGIKLIVIDSETELLARTGEEALDAIESNQPGTKARQSGNLLTPAKGWCYEAGIAFIVLCHARANIDMSAGLYAPKSKMAGGYSALHVPDVILQISAGSKVGDDKANPEGFVMHLVCDKCKFSRPNRKLDATLFYGKGISKRTYLVEWSIAHGFIGQNGSAYTTEDGKVFRGVKNLVEGVNEEQIANLMAHYNDYISSLRG